MESFSRRIFLGWDRPALQSAAEWLLGEASGGDLSGWLVVAPGGRVGRLLLGELIERMRLLSPPRFCTPGRLAEFLLPAESGTPEPAGPLLRRLAWVAALRAASPRTIDVLAPVGAAKPDSRSLRAWWQIAGMLEAAQAELAGELVLFEEVPERAKSGGFGGMFPDEERWLAAGEVQRLYEKLLAHKGLVDPELRVLRALRLEGSAKSSESMSKAVSVSKVALIGAADLGRGVREALRCFAGAGGEVVSLVFAPEELALRFDELGAVAVGEWAAAHVDLPEVRFAESAGDQAQLVMEAIAALDGQYAAHEIVVGVPDEEVTPFIERRAEQAAAVELKDGERRKHVLRVRAAAGVPLGQTAPFRLLRVVADYSQERSFAALAGLVRHPDVEMLLLGSAAEDEAMGGRGDGDARSVEWWLEEMDCYQAEHVPGDVSDEWYTDEERVRRALGAVEVGTREMLAELLSGAERRPLTEWARPLRMVMKRVYGDMRLSRNDASQRRTIEGNIAIRDVLVELERAGHLAGTDGAGELAPICTGSEAIEIILEIAGSGAVPEEGDEEAVELLGWLELPLDSAPVAIVTGLNEGRVPTTITGDALLPDSLREALGIASNRRRYGRDLYILAALAASRKQLTLIAGRRDADNMPLAPSRLLFACDPQQAVERVRLFTGDVASTAKRLCVAIREGMGGGAENLFRDMPLVPTEPVTSMRVTSFRTFLGSPYLFYLEHVLGLEERDDGCVELDPLAYGNLMHEVLERFGKSDLRHSADERAIEACVMDELAMLARDRFGSEPSTCIWLQLEFARRRLRDFSRFQAQRRREGWLIEHTEWRPQNGPAVFMVDGAPFGLRGKIDRIERHESTDVWAVLDYKTGDEVSKPGIAHRGRAGWRDLQLPLYRHLAASLNLPNADRLVLGYIALPKKPGSVQVFEADWDAEALADADEVARDVVRRVRAGEFLDIGDRPPDDGIKAALCGVGFVGAGRRARREDGEGDEL